MQSQPVWRQGDAAQGCHSHGSGQTIIALSATLFAIVLRAALAWMFGISASESHALIAGLTGSAIALHGSLDGVKGREWIKTPDKAIPAQLILALCWESAGISSGRTKR